MLKNVLKLLLALLFFLPSINLYSLTKDQILRSKQKVSEINNFIIKSRNKQNKINL